LLPRAIPVKYYWHNAVGKVKGRYLTGLWCSVFPLFPWADEVYDEVTALRFLIRKAFVADEITGQPLPRLCVTLFRKGRRLFAYAFPALRGYGIREREQVAVLRSPRRAPRRIAACARGIGASGLALPSRIW
jgi:hypothetical protein